jgi:hypothetical protein
MGGFVAVFVSDVDCAVADDELVVDWIIVVDDEPHECAGAYVKMVQVEVAVIDPDSYGDDARSDGRTRVRRAGDGGEHVSESGRRACQ